MTDQMAEAADELAAGVRSFLGSLPYTAPEAIGFQARVKLAGPLAEYDECREVHNQGSSDAASH